MVRAAAKLTLHRLSVKGVAAINACREKGKTPIPGKLEPLALSGLPG